MYTYFNILKNENFADSKFFSCNINEEYKGPSTVLSFDDSFLILICSKNSLEPFIKPSKIENVSSIFNVAIMFNLLNAHLESKIKIRNISHHFFKKTLSEKTVDVQEVFSFIKHFHESNDFLELSFEDNFSNEINVFRLDCMFNIFVSRIFAKKNKEFSIQSIKYFITIAFNQEFSYKEIFSTN